MEAVKKYYLIINCLLISLIYSDDVHIIYYGLDEGPNLVSFPILNENNEIISFFTSDNENLVSNTDLSEIITTVITEGSFCFQNELGWNGSLENINGEQGYWIVADEPISFMHIGESLNDNLYFLHPGANLISYPFSISQNSNTALSYMPQELIYAIIGANEALLSINGSWWGSLTQLNPGKGYWFIVNSYTPFQFSQPIESDLAIIPDDTFDDEILSYNQSTLQSAYFIESIYISGEENQNEINLEIKCNNIIVGQKIWNSNFTDIIAMGDDGFNQTENYCQNNDMISINSPDLNFDFHIIKGEKNWLANNFSINILSDAQLGDLNYNNTLNITDIIIMIEYILEISETFNNHQILLADINQDDSINITDIIINIENILDN